MTIQDRPLKVFVSAGEVSGDVLGGRLISALRALCPQGIEVQGVGGPEMAREGVHSLFPLSDLAIMGVFEIIPHIPKLKRRIAETADAVRLFAPDIMITIDAPGFNKRLARACGETDWPKVHYVAPTVWAWRPKRVYAFKALFDRLLCLLPFEPLFFEAVGLKADFVGHSILESGADAGDGPGFRHRSNIAPEAPVLCVLPGSRRGEMERLLPVFREVVSQVQTRQPTLHVIIPAVPHLAAAIKEQTASWPVSVTILEDQSQKYDAMAASNAALAASGTVALELALAKVPTVIAYKINGLTHFLVRRLIKTPYAHLLNILAKREIVPERIQGDCQPDQLSRDIDALLGPSGAQQAAALAPYLEQLKPSGNDAPSVAAARAALSVLEIKNAT
ncbi:MAG: lipid-A-disaccharide synthase [Alphaproteobacteria bacterium]|nr:lipid-A-disaccharide synthase [Alphaproteobacteria bacterium]